MIEVPSRLFSSDDDNHSPPASRIILSVMRLEDIEHVSRLERRCYTLPWSSSAYVTEVGNTSAQYVVAKDEAGPDELHVTTIAVDPVQRGRKIGERLLLNLIEESIPRGAERATLEVRERNVAAHSLYLKYGFEDVAVRKNYYSDNNENAIIMWANHLLSPEYQAMLSEYKRLLGDH